ncbi:MAG: sigma-70 family RNA polymerase sigma factor [Planctomycetes bacterium]|nr:sigma-70 family RNA polymerase sigma factor [Planctomycetota bacterium]MCB9884033.1 sigma-70 family RNA polymerase sigma factor [Planctomycetota bacterium]
MASATPPLESLFRHHYGALVASLCRVLGSANLELVEDVLQEAMVRALRSWSEGGVPDKPEGWVFRVARNLAFDALRRTKVAARVEQELERWAHREEVAHEPDEALQDDTLRMMFACCHPAVPAESRVPLVLKTVAGFGVGEIAAALLQKEATIAQRLSRAKARLQAEQVDFEVPPAGELPTRRGTVLDVVYLMFNEGYRAHRGSELVRAELVEDAVRLGGLLVEHEVTTGPDVHALLALMLLQGARLPARIDPAGEALTLAEQDRSRWDRQWLQAGFQHLQLAMAGDRFTAWHAQAGIASVHAAAPDYAATDWRRILGHYDRLLELTDTPIVRLNRAVAVGKVHGPAAGLAALQALEASRELQAYQLLPATRAQLCWLLGDLAAAQAELQRALALPCADPERRFLERRLDAVRRGDAPPAW